MKFLIVNSFHRDDKGDAALLHVLIDQLLTIDKNADIAIASMEDPKIYPTFYKGRNIGSFEFQSSSHAYQVPWHLFVKVYLFMAMLIVGKTRGRCTWLFTKEVKRIFNECKSAELVVSVGGGYFITKRDLGSRMHLIFALQTLMLCKQIGRKVVTAPVSVGPFQEPFEAKYATWLLKKLDLVLLREDVSREYFKDEKGNVPDNIKRAPDSGFAFSPEGTYDIRSVTGAKKGEFVLVISVRKWMTKSKQNIYEQAHADLLDYIAEKYPNIKPVFIPQCTFAYADDDDREVGKRILKRSKTKNASLITEALAYKQVKLSYKNADLIVGTRFHAMVFGLSYNVPGIAIEYEHKTRGIMRDLGLEEWVININEINSKKLINIFNKLINKKDFYYKYLSKKIPAYKIETQEMINKLSSLKNQNMKIIISHVFSNDNKGDAALLSVLLSDINCIFPNSDVSILTLDKIKKNEKFEGHLVYNSFLYYIFYRYNNKFIKLIYSIYVLSITLLWSFLFRYLKIKFLCPKYLRDILNLYSQADLILPVGGGYIRGKSGIANTFNLFLLVHPLILGYILKKPTILYSQSIGPFANRIQVACAKRILKNMDLIIVRENISYELLKSIGVYKNVIKSVDGGFVFSSNLKKDLRKELGVPKEKILIGITVRKWLSKDNQEFFENQISIFVDKIVEKYDAFIVFVPQVTCKHHSDDDRDVSQSIYKNVINKESTYVLMENYDHRTIKAIYNEFDYVVGNRFHSVIFSLTSLVPSIAIEYEHKTSGIMQELGLDKWVIKMEDVTADKLEKLFVKLITERQSYKDQLNKIIPDFIEQARNLPQIVKSIYESRVSKKNKK